MGGFCVFASIDFFHLDPSSTINRGHGFYAECKNARETCDSFKCGLLAFHDREFVPLDPSIRMISDFKRLARVASDSENVPRVRSRPFAMLANAITFVPVGTRRLNAFYRVRYRVCLNNTLNTCNALRNYRNYVEKRVSKEAEMIVYEELLSIDDNKILYARVFSSWRFRERACLQYALSVIYKSVQYG